MTRIKSKKVVDELLKEDRTFTILEAAIKDEICNYTYEVTAGIGIGDKHKVDGSGIVKESLLEAFNKFHVHLACIDEIFKHSKIEINDIDTMHTHELSELYRVSGFKIKSSKGYDTIKLTGMKYVSSAGGWMEIKTHEIVLDNLSPYKWYNELKTAADKAREEVSLYKEGNYTPVEKEEEEENDNQGSLFKASAADEKTDEEFAEAAI